MLGTNKDDPSEGPAALEGSRTTRLVASGRFVAELVALGALLFFSRYVIQGYLAPRMDQECHIGGIAIDVLAHGVRFPLLAYAPNEYDNGSFVQGLLTALGYTLFGRNVLVLRLVTHAWVTAGALATVWLLRTCTSELGWTRPRQRWLGLAALLISLAFAPRIVTMMSMYGVANHPEGAAIDAILLALFATRIHTRSSALTAAFWALVGVALYVNKGTFIAIPVLVVAEIVLSRRSPLRLGAALLGLIAGVMPEAVVVMHRHGDGWAYIAEKAEQNSESFPWAFFSSVATGADHRIELLVPWALALALGVALAWRKRSLALGMVVGFSLLHLAALSVMARSFMDFYVLYGYPPIAVLSALLIVAIADAVIARTGERAALATSIAALALVAVAYRPAATSWSFDTVRALSRDRAGAACSWRFAEGFSREHFHGGAPPGLTREEHVIARCRSLSEEVQVADCIGGIARELHWRRDGHITSGAPPPALTELERRAYAYHYGTHRGGDTTDCGELDDPELRALCTSAAGLECLVFADALTRMRAGRPLGRPSCAIEEPPDDAFWGAMRRDFLGREPGLGPDVPREAQSLASCQPVFAACYGD